MNYSITLYNFSKRTNSTKRPSGSGIGTYVCSLIEPTSIHNPVITLHLNDISPLLNANYAKFGDEFYYIEDIVVNTNTEVEFRLEKDVLASFNSQIRNTTAFIELSTSNYDTDINDTRIGATDNWEHYFESSSSDKIVGNGSYFIVSIAGLNEAKANQKMPMSQILMGTDALDELVRYMYNTDFIQYMNDTYTNGLKDAIASITFIPCNINKFLPSDYRATRSISIGNHPITLSTDVYVLGNTIFTPYNSKSAGNPKYPKVVSEFDVSDYLKGDFRDGSDYLQFRIYLPMGENVEINASQIYGMSRIIVITRMDIMNASLSYTIYASDEDFSENEDDMHMIYTSDVNIGITLPFGSVVTNYKGAMRYVGALAHNLSKGFGGDGFSFGEYTDPLLKLRATLTGQQNSQVFQGGVAQGSNVSACIRYGTITLEIIRRELLMVPSSLEERYGRPCNQILRIGDLSGFVKTQGCSVSANAPRSEIESVNSLVNGGIYLE